MKGRHALLLVMLLALAGIVGIVGMLLTEGALNALFFALAALPLAAGMRWRMAARDATRGRGAAMNVPTRETRLLRLAGIAGVLGALGWTIGDILIVGHRVDHAAYPLLFETYANRLDAGFAERLVGVPHERLMAGALFAVFTVPLYLIGGWHLWRGIHPVGPRWAMPAAALVFVGYALSPLAHAAFYFVGTVYQTILVTEPSAHAALLTLAGEFRYVLLMVWVPSVACQLLGLLVFSLAVATGRSAYPRWFALSSNPVLLGLLTIGGPHLLRGPVGDALAAAAFNTTWLLVYLQSLFLLRKQRDDQLA